MNRRLLLVLAVVSAIGGLAVIGSGPASAQELGTQPTRCMQACRQQAQLNLEKCLATGAEPARCRQRVQAAAEQCAERCRRAAEVKPDPSKVAPEACQKRCELVGRTVYRACMLLPIGPTREQCQTRAQQAVKLCIEKACPKREQPDPEPTTCQEKCNERARAYYDRCVLGSTGATPPEDCAKKARQMLRECLVKCDRSSVAPDPVPAECRERCIERVDRWIEEQCMTQPGATQERCEKAGAEKLRTCVAACK